MYVKYLDLGGTVTEAVASVIGGGGFFIEKFTPLPEGGARLEFFLPASPKVITARVKVVWNRKTSVQKFLYSGMAVKFVELSEEDRREITEFVNRFNRERGFQEF